MKIAIIGYGKMGKEVEKAARTRGIEIASIIDKIPGENRHTEISSTSLKGADVAIDFTKPKSALENIRKVAALKKNMVMATTGWYDQTAEAKEIIRKSGTGIICSTNFSIGVNLYFRIIEEAARLFNNAENYDVYGYELHHSQKMDSPSGTAKTTAELLLKNINRKKKAVYDRGKISPEDLHFASIRAGSIPGTHVVGFDSEADTIEIKHTARNRSGFAMGAVMAAEWINGKKGFYTMEDLMKDYWGKKDG
ncbi:4-hydroxy-tetrahydrodipicolinate reductase [Candidatus Woesearchaeota archaeon]|nr:4-hydroxy-tetrahydrodipicolinate reductase [Candidatus Woesearchaeota archaeon]